MCSTSKQASEMIIIPNFLLIWLEETQTDAAMGCRIHSLLISRYFLILLRVVDNRVEEIHIIPKSLKQGFHCITVNITSKVLERLLERWFYIFTMIWISKATRFISMHNRCPLLKLFLLFFFNPCGIVRSHSKIDIDDKGSLQTIYPLLEFVFFQFSSVEIGYGIFLHMSGHMRSAVFHMLLNSLFAVKRQSIFADHLLSVVGFTK
jgi:hypothetical protein